MYLDFNGKKILIFILSSSPQESTEYCNFESVIERLKKFVKKCERRAEEEGVTKFLIIVAFTLQVNRDGELGKDCITNPLDFLKSLDSYKTHVVHVNRDNTRYDYRTNEFIKNNTSPELILESEETSTQRQDENARKLKEFLAKLI